jgi:Fic family protein
MIRNITNLFLQKETLSSSQVHHELIKGGESVSLVTIKRTLSAMVNQGVLSILGGGRSTAYTITTYGRLFADVDTAKYNAIEPDSRFGLAGYNFDLFKSFPLEIFTQGELDTLNNSTLEYQSRAKSMSFALKKKELERLVIELSWKSSKIEGNTYTLLDTEKLILENKIAAQYSQEETQMILNHKDTFEYVRQHPSQFTQLNQKNLEELHAILVKKLNINSGFRSQPVGVTGSRYRPLDNLYQITDAINQLSKTISRLSSPFDKAMIALLGISYIQPFEDGNKRTSRLMANALLISHQCAPLSYRSVVENDYREAMLVFYELNSLIPFKKIFIDQYQFAAKTYSF